MIKHQSGQERQSQQENVLSYQSKKLLHMIELQILDIESTLHYIQKKHTMHQLKQALSQVYNIFNQTQPLFKLIKGNFLHQQIKKIMNCFGIIYVILMDHIDNKQKGCMVDNVEVDTKIETKSQIEATNKQIKVPLDNQKGQLKIKPRSLGGVHLYNERYTRHIQNEEHFRKIRPIKTSNNFKNPTKEELNKMISEEINDNSHLNAQPDEILDIFSFKFKYGKQNQIVTFHDELLSIANFFKQSQNQAFQFLNKTKDQTSIIAYNDSFNDVMHQIKMEKQQKIKIFTEKIKAAFGSIKTKTEKKVAEIQNKLVCMEETQHTKSVNKVERETQTNFNIDEQIKSLKRQLADSQEKYKLMMDFKKKELEENTMVCLEFQSEIGLKNRQIVYLKLNVEQNTLMISNLNKRIKFLTDSHRKIKDFVKNSEEPGKIMEVIDNKTDTDKFLKQEADDQMALEVLRKQRKMAKKILLQKRKTSLLADKSVFMKRFTQQIDSSKITPNNLLSRNLSEINQGEGSQIYDDLTSMASNKNNLISEESNRPYSRRKTKKISIIPDQKEEGSTHSIKSRHSFTTKSKKNLKQKHTSEIINNSNRTSFLNKIKQTPQSINEDSILDECSSQQKDYIDKQNKQGRISVNSSQLNKIEEMFKKQMSRTKNIINNNKRFSSFNNNHRNNKSFFSSQKQNTQESVPSSSSVHKVASRNKFSFRSSHQDEEEKNVQRLSKKVQNDENISQNGNVVDLKRPASVRKPGKQKQQSTKLKIYTNQISISIFEPIIKKDEIIQTQQKRIPDQDEETSYSEIKQITFSNNTIHLSKTKDAVLNEVQTPTELVTRSATQSKMSKNKHLKTLYSISSKENEKYLFSFAKNTEKSVDEEFKNSLSCLQMQDDVNKEFERMNEDKKEDFIEPAEKLKEQRQMRKLAIKCRTLQQFKARVSELHKQRCGHNCKHLQKFVQNYIKYKQELKPKMKMPIKNLCDNINFTSTQEQQKNYFPMLQKKRN